MKNSLTLLHHEIRLQARQKAEWASLLLFFVIVITLMPFALGADAEILRRLAPGLIWLAALLMSLLSLDRLFVQDARDGTLDEMLVSPAPLESIVLAKILAQILVMILVLALMSLPAALLLGMDAQAAADPYPHFHPRRAGIGAARRHRGRAYGYAATQCGFDDLAACPVLYSYSDFRRVGLRCRCARRQHGSAFAFSGSASGIDFARRALHHRCGATPRTRIEI